jgi:hypothetical protein
MAAKKPVNPTKQSKLRKVTGAKKGAKIPQAKLQNLTKHPNKAVATQAKFALNKRKVQRKAK